MPGAIVTLTLTLYPYVYLLARAALRDQAATALLRRPHARRLARPRRPAGSCCRCCGRRSPPARRSSRWRRSPTSPRCSTSTSRRSPSACSASGAARYDRDAASEIATLVLVFAVLAIGLERILRGRARFGESGGEAAGVEPVAPARLARPSRPPSARRASSSLGVRRPDRCGWSTWAIAEQRSARGHADGRRATLDFLGNSLTLTARHRRHLPASSPCSSPTPGGSAPTRVVGVANRVSIVGYAVPGPVVAMGVVLALVALDDLLERGRPRPARRSPPPGRSSPSPTPTPSASSRPASTPSRPGIGQVPVEVTASAQLARRPAACRCCGRIHLPLARTSVLAAAVLVGVDALKELPIAYLLRPVGFDTLPVWVYDLASESRFEQAALPALTIIAVALVPVAILSRHLDQRRSSSDR